MKKLITLLFLSLFSSNAFAEQIPDGCYVTFNNPGFCYSSYSGYYEWNVSGNRSFDRLKYGNAFEALLNQWNIRDIDATYNFNGWNSCTAAYNSLAAEKNSISAQYSGLANSYNSNEANRQEWIAYGTAQAALAKKQTALAKKLKKACGSKCKSIK